nr:hypothetical protein CFP56_71652 [Quercus suber]
MSESAIRSSEEDDELQRSTKKVKENCRGRGPLEQHSPRLGGEGISYKEKLIRDIRSAFEQAFNFENVMETEAKSDKEEEEELLPREVVVKLSSDRKAKIRAAWNNTLIVKVFRKTVSYHYLVSKLTSLWKPTKANLSTIVVWIRLPELPIEYYEASILKDMGKAIGPVLRVDTHTTSESKGKFARLCVQVNLDEPLVDLIRIGGIRQRVQYEGLGSLCFSYGKVMHQAKGYPYKV